MMTHDTYRMLTSGYTFDMSPFLVYAIPSVIVPLVVFVILYILANKKSTRVWRAFQAALLAVFVVMAYGVLMTLNDTFSQRSMGYGQAATMSTALLLQLVPSILSIVLAIGVGMWMKAKEKVANDLSLKTQKNLVITLVPLVVVQSVVSFIAYSGGVGTQSLDMGALAITFLSFALPAVAVAILYLVTSRLRTKMQRVFLATMYTFIGVLITMMIVSLSYQIAGIVGSGMVDSPIASLSPWLGLVATIGIVVWHKLAKAI